LQRDLTRHFEEEDTATASRRRERSDHAAFAVCSHQRLPLAGSVAARRVRFVTAVYRRIARSQARCGRLGASKAAQRGCLPGGGRYGGGIGVTAPSREACSRGAA
jgi:hypothetical protein